MRVVKNICSHVAVLNHGKLAEKGTVKEVFTNPKSSAAKVLILNDEEQDKFSGEVYEGNVG